MRKLFLACLSLLVVPMLVKGQSVDLLWQGDVYTPPFYEGRSLWSPQSRITFLAVPQISGVNPSTLEYRWSKDGVILGKASGVGVNSLYFIGSALAQPVEIRVEIISQEGAVLAENQLTVKPSETNLLVFENNPLYGIMFHKEVGGTYEVLGTEISLSAFPLFFSVDSNSSLDLSYRWSSGSGNTGLESSVSYVVPKGATGLVRISARAESVEKVMQGSNKKFVLEFKNEE